MRRIPNMKQTLIGCTTLVVCGTLGVAAIAQYGDEGGEDGLAPPTDPPQPPGERAERPEQTHSGVVVDLTSFLEKEQEQQDRRPSAPDRQRMQRESPPSPPPQPGRPGARDDRDEDTGIDWTEGEYRENLDEGVPIVLMIEEQARWRSADHQPHVVTFDPKNGDSKDAYEQLKGAAGEKVEVTGDIRKEGAIRGLSVITIKNVE